MLARWIVIATVHLWALWMISPQVLSDTTAEYLDSWLPRERLAYDIALVGGTTLLLDIDTDDEVARTLWRDASLLHGHKQGQTLLVPADADTLAQVARDFPHYRVTGTVQHDGAPHAVLSPALAWVQHIEAAAVRRTKAVIQDRLVEQGKEATITLEGNHSLRINSRDPGFL